MLDGGTQVLEKDIRSRSGLSRRFPAGSFEGVDALVGGDASRTVAVGALGSVGLAGSRPTTLQCRERYQWAMGMECHEPSIVDIVGNSYRCERGSYEVFPDWGDVAVTIMSSGRCRTAR
jgi:hypothetical protein